MGAKAGALAAILDHEVPLGMEVTSWEGRVAGRRNLEHDHLVEPHNTIGLSASWLLLNERSEPLFLFKPTVLGFFGPRQPGLIHINTHPSPSSSPRCTSSMLSNLSAPESMKLLHTSCLSLPCAVPLKHTPLHLANTNSSFKTQLEGCLGG